MAAKRRINITFDEETLRLADRGARRQKSSRSEYIRGLIQKMAEGNGRASREVAQRERRQAAIEGIRRIAHKFGDWPAEQLVHDWRYRLKLKGR